VNLEEGLLCWGSRRLCKGRLWRQASLFMGAPLGNLEGGSFTRDFDRWMKEGLRKWSVSLRGTWREGSFTENPKGYVK